MSRVLLVLGWVVAICAIVGSGFFFQQNMTQAKRLNLFETEMATLRDEVVELRQVKMEAEKERDALEEEAEELREVVALAEENALNNTEAMAAEGGNPLEKMGEQIANMLGGESEDGEENSMAKAMQEMFSGEQGEQIAEMQSNMITEMGYSDFFADAQLPEDVEDSVRGMLKSHSKNMMQLGIKALQGDLSKEDREAMQEQFKADEEVMHGEIKKLLTQEEYDLFEAYDGEKEARMVAKSYEMQMGMMAPQVTPESREIFVDVVMDELLGVEGFGDDQFSEQNQGMPAGVFDGIRERMIGQVPEEQLEHINRFITQQEDLMTAITGGMQNDQ